MAEEIAQVAVASERQRTGHAPESVRVMLEGETLVITYHGALSPAERALLGTPDGAVQVQGYHRRLFESDSQLLRDEIQRITGSEVRQASAEVDTRNGAVMRVFPTGTTVQVFLLASAVPPDAWSGDGLQASR